MEIQIRIVLSQRHELTTKYVNAIGNLSGMEMLRKKQMVMFKNDCVTCV